MIFEKKVIIGSVVSFIATAVGIVAVFFPDLLNLQKEKIKNLKIDLVTQNDIDKFKSFLNERVKDGGIFELDVCVLVDTAYTHLNAQSYIDETAGPNDGNDIRLIFADKKYKFPKEYVWYEDDLICEDVGISCYDFRKIAYTIDYFSMSRKRLDKDEQCYYTLKGNVYFDKKLSNLEFNLNGFNIVTEEQLKLKNY